MTTYAADTFNRADGAVGTTATGGFTWTSSSQGAAANWAIATNRLTGTGGGEAMLTIDDSQADGAVQATWFGGSSSGLILRYKTTTDFYWLRVQSGSNITLYRFINGTGFSQVAFFAGTPTSGDVIRAEMVGTTITVFRNGTQLFAGSDTTNTTATRHGFLNDAFGSVASSWDDFSHVSIAVPDTTPPTAPTTVSANPGNASASVTFSGATDNVAVTSYRLYSSADSYTTPVATGSTSPLSATGLTNGTAYTFKVSAGDAAGNWSTLSAASNSVTPSATAGTIAPNDANLVYSPYNWTVSGTTAQTSNSGAYLRAAIKGSLTSLTANFNVTGATGTQRVSIYVDGVLATVANVTATITIPLTGQGWTEHLIELVFHGLSGTDLWTAPTAGVKFTGFTVAPTSATTTTARRRPLNVLCYGDSIAIGYLAGTDQTDARFGWALPMRDLLGAEVGVAGFTGQGWNNVGNGNVPIFTTTYNGIYSGAARSFTTPAEPTAVVINMGTNDASNNITTQATTVLNGILAATTNTRIVVLRPFINANQATNLQAAIAACTAPTRCTYVDTAGWLAAGDTIDGTHPFGYIELADLAPRIAAAVRAALPSGGGVTPRRFLNKAGTAVAIS